MLDLLIHNASLPNGQKNMSVAVQNGRIVEVTQGLRAPAHRVVDAQGHLLSPPFVDAHFHMDATLSYGLPRVNDSLACRCVRPALVGRRCAARSQAPRRALHRPATGGLSARRRAARQPGA